MTKQIDKSSLRDAVLFLQLNSNAVLHELMTHVAKVVEIIGGSDKGWTEAAQASIGRGQEDHPRDYWSGSE